MSRLNPWTCNERDFQQAAQEYEDSLLSEHLDDDDTPSAPQNRPSRVVYGNPELIAFRGISNDCTVKRTASGHVDITAFIKENYK